MYGHSRRECFQSVQQVQAHVAVHPYGTVERIATHPTIIRNAMGLIHQWFILADSIQAESLFRRRLHNEYRLVDDGVKRLIFCC